MIKKIVDLFQLLLFFVWLVFYVCVSVCVVVANVVVDCVHVCGVILFLARFPFFICF